MIDWEWRVEKGWSEIWWHLMELMKMTNKHGANNYKSNLHVFFFFYYFFFLLFIIEVINFWTEAFSFKIIFFNTLKISPDSFFTVFNPLKLKMFTPINYSSPDDEYTSCSEDISPWQTR